MLAKSLSRFPAMDVASSAVGRQCSKSAFVVRVAPAMRAAYGASSDFGSARHRARRSRITAPRGVQGVIHVERPDALGLQPGQGRLLPQSSASRT